MVHIVDGDNTAELLSKAGLNDEVIACREMFISGKSEGNTFNEILLNRANYFQDHFDTTIEKYTAYTITEFHRIRDIAPDEEIMLWFEADTFCQVNLLACLAFIDELGIHRNVRVIFPHMVKPNTTFFYENLSETNYAIFIAQSEPVPADAIRHGARLWKNWMAGELNGWSVDDAAIFTVIPKAIDALQHLLFPKEQYQGLNRAEHTMLKLIQTSPTEKRKIIGAILRDPTFKLLGLGDYQYLKLLEGLNRYWVETDGILELTKLGVKILVGEIDHQRISPIVFGGVSFS